VVPASETLDAALAWAGELAHGPAIALSLAKRAIEGGLDSTLTEGLELEHELFVEVFRTDDARAGIASFREHGPGKATFTGR
jgi:enoyl-CoA hydratase/carnithine racemase